MGLAVRIVTRPEGEAPEWVREAWVGLVLPTAHARPRSVRIPLQGRLKISWLRRLGAVFGLEPAEKRRSFAVPAGAALRVLAAANPAAADWWRRETPHVRQHSYHFLFDEAVCQPDWIGPRVAAAPHGPDDVAADRRD